MPDLRQVLTHEFPDIPVSELRGSELESRVLSVYFDRGAPCSSKSVHVRAWPGPHENVSRWYELRDGNAIGIQENPGGTPGFVRAPYKKIQRIDWNRLRTCRLVHEAGSFTKAAALLDVTQSAVSRQIAALEQDIGCDLFIRSSSGLVPTEIGEYFLETIRKMWETLDLGLARVNEMREEPAGPVVLTTTQAFGSAWLSSRISKFHHLYPKIEVKLLLSDSSELNLRQRAADCAIRFQPPTDPGLIRRLIAEFTYGIFASKDYLAERGSPKSLEELDHHDLITYSTGFGNDPISEINWLQHVGMPQGATRRAAVQVNSIYGIYRAVETGAGLGAIPFYLSERSSALVEVLSHVPRPTIPVYFVYPEELRPSKRIQVLRDFITTEVMVNWSGRVVSIG